MRIEIDGPLFAEERQRFAFRFCCEHCGHFVPELEGCAHFWPNGEHREAHFAREMPEQVLFCKEFELR